MKVGFFSNSLPFEADLLEDGLAGGSENALVNITREWKKNYPEDEIIVYNNNSGKYSEYNGVTWKSIVDFNLEIRTVNLDAIISLRDPEIFYMQYLDAKLKVLWSQDNMEEPRLQKLSIHKYGIVNIDQIFAISQFAYDDIKKSFPNSKIDIIRNGFTEDWICDNTFLIKNKPVAVYTSTPFRGLDLLANFWPIICNECKKRGVDPQLKIYGGMSLYNQQEGRFEKLYNLLKKMPNVEVKGSIYQKKLYKELSGASVMLYPNTHTETGCMAVTEALANNVWVVTTNKGALGEQVVNNQNGYLIDGDPYSEEYRDLFISNAVTALIKKPLPDNKGLIFTWKEQAKKMRKIIGYQI